MPQEQIHAKATSHPASKNATTDADIDRAVAEAQARDASTVAALADDLLDEIDACLEENAVEVLVGYVQRGGQ